MGRPPKSKKEIDTTSDIMDVDVDKLIQELSSKFGSGVSFQGGQPVEEYKKGVSSTGLVTLDKALGVGGYPIGRTIELFGMEASGKTNLALRGAAEALKMGWLVFFIDMEHSLDVNLASNIGIDTGNKNFCISQPDYGEQAFEIIETVLRSGAKAFIVLDSVASLVTKTELDKGFLDSVQPGRQAALMSNALKRLTGVINQSNSILVFVNQMRHTIGMMGGAAITPGGKALKFYASIRIRVSAVESIGSKENKIGHKARLRIEKNKMAIPFKETEVNLYYGSGFCATADVLNAASALGIVTKSGTWFAYEGEKLGQGELNTIKLLVERKDLYLPIRDKVLAEYKMPLIHPMQYTDKTIMSMNSGSSVEIDENDITETPITEELAE